MSAARRVHCVLAAMLVLALSARARRGIAHEAIVAHLEVEALSSREARVSSYVTVGARPTLGVPSDCDARIVDGATRVISCRRPLPGRILSVEGLGEGVNAALVRFSGFEEGAAPETRIATSGEPEVSVPGAASWSQTASGFLTLGATHVAGVDHVLFLVALFWHAWERARGQLARAAADLARLATIFTIAHSLSLGVTALGLLRLPQAAAEAAIAWSLVLVAADLGKARGGHSFNATRGGWPLGAHAVVAVFGLVHGLGFAQALSETRLPEASRAAALFAFNLGVELGQALILAACVATLVSLRVVVRSRKVEPRLMHASAFAVGVAGALMFVSRSLALFQG